MRVLFGLCAATALTGCTTLVAHVGQSPVTATEIFKASACEILLVTDRDDERVAFLGDWTGTISTDLSLKDTSSSTPGLSWETTVNGVTWTAGPSAGLEGTREGHVVVNFPIERVADLRKKVPDCPRIGGLGLTSWLASSALIMDDALGKGGAAGADTPLKYEVWFTATRTAAGGLSFKIEDITVGLNANSYAASNTNKLTVTFAPPKGGKGGGGGGRQQAITRQLEAVDQVNVLRDALKEAQ
jgi:hypothetical protein